MEINRQLRLARRIFWRDGEARLSNPFSRLRENALCCELSIRMFYAISFFTWMDYLRSHRAGLDHVIVAHPVWPLFWLGIEDGPYWANIFFALNLIAALIVTVFPHRREWRGFSFLSIFLICAILSSDVAGWERMGHHSYHYVLISFLFIFLPRRGLGARKGQWRIVFITLLAQITILTSYASSAICRLRESATSFMLGESLSIGWDALPKFIESFQFNNRTGILGPFLLEHRMVAGPLMFIFTAVELASVYVIFTPKLYRPYGILIVLMHLGFVLAMGLQFNEHLFLVLIFLVCSPLTRVFHLK